MDASDGENRDGAAPSEAPAGTDVGAHSTPPRRAPLDADGMERPRFLLDFPEDPELEPLIEAFEAGNYARVRKDGERLSQTAESAAVREAARELRRRIEPDPLAKYLLAVSFALLVVLGTWAYHVQSH